MHIALRMAQLSVGYIYFKAKIVFNFVKHKKCIYVETEK